MSQPPVPSAPFAPPLRRVGLLAGASFLAVMCAFGQTPTSPAGGQVDPSAPTGTDPSAGEPSGVPVGGKRDKKEKKKEAKLTAQQKKRIEIEQSGRTALQWYDQAVATYRSGKYLDARAILLPLEDSARALDIQEQVKLLIADTYFAQGGALNLAEALARYKSFSTFFPSSEHAEYVQFQIARSYYKQMAPLDRDQSFTDSVVAEHSRFLALFPESKNAEQAKKELAEARILRARSEFDVAKFYWQWKDYRGSATRLRTVLQEYPELPEREEALYMCAQSLYNSGERAEGDSFAARLEQDYPGSAWNAKLDSGAAGGRTIEQQVQKQLKAEKQSARSASRQARQDRKRTKQIRKDSGLPGNVPGVTQVARAEQPASPARPADAAAPETSAADSSAREAEAGQRDRERAEKLEAEETAKLAQDAQQQAKRDAKKAEGDAKAAEKAAREEAKREAKAASMSDEQKEQAAAKEAKAAATEKARVDKLEAEEAKKAAEEAEAQKKREEEAAAKAAKKAEKKAGKR